MAKRSRKRSAWGSITEVERGKRYVIRYWASTDERGYRRCCETVRGTRVDAERRRAELMLAHSDDAPCPTVGALWSTYAVPDMERMVEGGDMAETTLPQYRSWWAKHVGPQWDEVSCDDVRPLAIQQWISTLGLSQATNSLMLLKKVLDYAVRYEFIGSNPAREKYLMPSKSTVSKRDKGVWKLAELEGVWRRVYGSWMEPAFIVAAFGGTRVGEALGPLAGDVSRIEVNDIEIALVRICRQVEHRGNVSDRLKNQQSVRSVAIAGKAASRLLELSASKNPDSFLTDDGFGGHVSQMRYMNSWRKLKMDHPFRNLRNSWQTWMRWELKVEPYYIEPMMGHMADGVTGQYYDRPQAEVFASVVAEAYERSRYDEAWVLGH